ncbi:MAG: hypothetical protein JW931_05980 [Methanomicrobiaceae archaeon]|nr:hypothetical protein [Methanomicrobiaceae archaeon]
MRRKDDAIAPVVAMLLILAAIVTLISIYNSGYMPQLKEEAEVEHIAEVESAFMDYVTYIENSAREKKGGTVSIPVKLGGGDIFLSSIRSGGALSVSGCSDIISISNESEVFMNGTLCSLEYETVGNFWHDRGYNWSYGIVNISEFSNEMPLRFAGMDAACDFIENDSGFSGSLVNVDFSGRHFSEFDADGNFTGRTYYNCTAIYVDIVRIQGDPDCIYVSGNGDAIISMDTVLSQELNMTGRYLNFKMTDMDGEGVFLKRSLLNGINTDLYRIKREGFANIEGVDGGNDWCSIISNDNVPFLVRFVNITIAVR